MNKLVTKDKINKYYYIDVSYDSGVENVLLIDSEYSILLNRIGNACGDESMDVMAYCLMNESLKLLICAENKCSGVCIAEIIADIYRQVGDDRGTVFKIVEVESYDQLLSVSKEVHLAPNSWLDYPHSSIRAYLYDDKPDFLNKTHISNIYGSAVEYFDYLNC